MNEFDDSPDALDLGLILGQRRAFVTVGGRCSAANAQILRRIRDQKLYRVIAPSWRVFCVDHLVISRRHADYLISLLVRFGPIYFELSQLIGLSPSQYLAIEPAVRQDCLVVDGHDISLIPENVPSIIEAVDRILIQSGRRARRSRTPESLSNRLAGLASRGRVIANQLVSLYHASPSPSDRDRILEIATELRLILMQPGTE
jgi:hypothetical protein